METTRDCSGCIIHRFNFCAGIFLFFFSEQGCFLLFLSTGYQPREILGGAQLPRGEGRQVRRVVGAPAAALERAPDAL